MIVSHQHRFIFFKTRKTAGTSIEMALQALCGPDDIIAPSADGVRGRNGRLPLHLRPVAWWWRARRNIYPLRRIHHSRFVTYYPHERAELIRHLVGRRIFDSYFKFTVERNPWDREVSLYFWRTRKQPETSFQDFVRTNPQQHWVDNFMIYTIDGTLVADHVIRYEKLSEEMTRLAGIIGWKPQVVTLPHVKPRRVKRTHYQSFYDEKLRDIIAERHRREIELFKYEFE
jgi:hypothetical protein